jgi:hypothetical protein
LSLFSAFSLFRTNFESDWRQQWQGTTYGNRLATCAISTTRPEHAAEARQQAKQQAKQTKPWPLLGKDGHVTQTINQLIIIDCLLRSAAA